MIIFLCGQTYINIFIVYICPDENSVYFYLSCVPSSAILRGMITCYVSAYCKTQMHILPPECLQKTFSKGLLSNFPVSKRFFFPAYFSRRITRHLQSFSSIIHKSFQSFTDDIETQSDRICYPYHGIQLFFLIVTDKSDNIILSLIYFRQFRFYGFRGFGWVG